MRSKLLMWMRLSRLGIAVSCLAFSGHASDNAEVQSLREAITAYATSIDRADTAMAEQLWSNAPEASFIHPLGEEHGRAQVEQNVYLHLMGDTFSERRLTPKDISVHVYGEAAWSEFKWDFVAKFRKDGRAFHSQGRETQIYRKEHGRWRLVHVHYSGMPGIASPTGF